MICLPKLYMFEELVLWDTLPSMAMVKWSEAKVRNNEEDKEYEVKRDESPYG